MQVIKVHKHWKLYARGYRAAFRFDGFHEPNEFYEMVDWLKEHFGEEAIFSFQDESRRWTRYLTRPGRWNQPRHYFIAVKDEMEVSVILLQRSGK
jgi:hypothetical protein